MKTSLSRNLVWAITIFLFLSLVFSFVAQQQGEPAVLSINELVAKIEAGEVSTITVRGNELAIELIGGEEAVSQKEAEAGLSETLSNYGITTEALAGVKFVIENESGFKFWLSLLLPALLPLLIIGVFIWLMFRQARSGMSQAFTFGKANIKLFTQFKERVMFKDVAGLKEAKQELVEVVDFLKNPKKYLEIGARIPRGVLLVGPPGTGKCVVGNTLVATNKGLIEIHDIPKYFWVNSEDHTIEGAYLPSINIEQVKNEERRASHWYDLGEQPTVNIRLRQGTELEGTPEHPVAIMDTDGRLVFKPLSELRQNDLVAVQFNTQAFGTLRDVDNEQAYLLGLLTGDGNLSHASRIGLTTTDSELAHSFHSYVGNRYPGTAIALADDGITHLVSSWQMKRDLYRAGMSYLLSYDKVIPPSILLAPKDIVIAFLQGLFDTDGYVERYTAGFATVSKTLSDQVLALLLNLGIVAKRRTKHTINTSHPRPVYELTISGTSLAVFAQKVGFRLSRKQAELERYLATHATGNTNVDIFYHLTPYIETCWQALHRAHKSTEQLARVIDKVRQRKRVSRRSLQILTTACEHSDIPCTAGNYLRALLTAQLFFSPIESISSGRGRVYDFTVPGTHSFISNGLVSHNTMLARAVAGESNVPFFHLSASELVEMFVGVGAARTRDAFATAKRSAPAILFVDEIDAIGRERGAGLGGGHDEREQTLNQILVEMDGFERDTKLIVLAATNRPDVLDSALLRPGRFDRRVLLDLPDIADREEILKIHARGKSLVKDIIFRRVAERTPGFSGADLANLMNEAVIFAARHNRKQATQQDILDSIEKVMLGPERRSRVITKREKERTAYHEAGHALVTASLKGSDPVHKITIISRGRAGGYTLKLPVEETHLRTKKQFLNDIATLLGGYVSELLTFGDISTGASNDLQVASETARKLITRYGMSEKLGPLTYGKTQEHIFLGKEITTEKNYSEQTAALIDSEVRSLIEKAFLVAKKIIAKRKNLLKAIAQQLITKETIERDEFENLLKTFKLKPIAFQ